MIRLVYFGPDGAGKATNLHRLERDLDTSEMSLSPLSHEVAELWLMKCQVADYSVAGMVTRFEVCSVQGEAPPRVASLLLQGVDGVVFVADSRPERQRANEDSLRGLEQGLHEKGLDYEQVPLVFQWNKRDVDGALAEAALSQGLNAIGAPVVESTAIEGAGVVETFHTLARLVTARLEKQYGLDPKKDRGSSDSS